MARGESDLISVRYAERQCHDTTGHRWELVTTEDNPNWPLGIVCMNCGRDRAIVITDRRMGES